MFPLVSFNHLPGREHHYEWNGRVFPLPQHGFARRLPWSVTHREADRLTMALVDTDETRRVYPFSFLHEVTYALENGRLAFEQLITNRSKLQPAPP